MKVTEILKGKKAYEKEFLLNDKELDSKIVDKLATDPAKSVRRKAAYHPNITQEGLYKIASQKKNFADTNILSIVYDNFDNIHKFKAIENRLWKEYSNIQYIGNSIHSGLQKSEYKDAVSKIFRDEYISGDEKSFIESWLLRFYDVVGDKELFDYFIKNKPEKLIAYSDEQNLSQKETMKIFDTYLETSSKYWARPSSDLGYGFIESLSSDNLTKLLKRGFRLDKSDFHSILENPNLTSEHTMILVDDIIKEGKLTEHTRTVFRDFPLDKKIDKKIYQFIKREQSSYGGNTRNWDWREFELWTANPTHDKSLIKKILTDMDIDDGWSSTAVYNAVSTGMYDENDLDDIMKNKPEYYRKDLDIELITNPNAPDSMLRDMWKTYWYGKWNKGEIPSRIYAAGDIEEYHKIVYGLVSKSKLKDEFGMDYFNVLDDDTYLPQEAKDMFLF